MFQGSDLNLSDQPVRRGQTQPGPNSVASSGDVTAYTGWEVYNHTGGAQSISTGVRTQLSINGGSKITSQKPTDVAALWDTATNTITGRNGDGIVVKIEATFTPSSALATDFLFEVDIGGSVGVVESRGFPITLGAGMPHKLPWTFAAYTLDTWEANGGKVYMTVDGPGSVTVARVLIQRTHKAR